MTSNTAVITRRSVFTEGLISGIIGATAVAAWFLIVDIVRGSPFFVPAGLGHALLHGAGVKGVEGRLALVIAYTVFHYVAFIIAGVIAATILRRSEQQPSLLVGALFLLVVFELGFLGLSSLIAMTSALGTSGWLLVSIGNIIAAVAMGLYLRKAYPAAGSELNAALRGDDDQPGGKT